MLDLAILKVTGFCLFCFAGSGLLHTLWLKSGLFTRLSFPLDFGIKIRNHRLFGDNKTFAGFLVLVPATGLFFATAQNILPFIDEETLAASQWPTDVSALFSLGLVAGLGYMLAELPNSFLKRQFGLKPGSISTNRFLRLGNILIDQLDSVVGALIALSLFVPVSLQLWFCVVLGGFFVHWAFNYLLYRVGIKQSPY